MTRPVPVSLSFTIFSSILSSISSSISLSPFPWNSVIFSSYSGHLFSKWHFFQYQWQSGAPPSTITFKFFLSWIFFFFFYLIWHFFQILFCKWRGRVQTCTPTPPINLLGFQGLNYFRFFSNTFENSGFQSFHLISGVHCIHTYPVDDPCSMFTHYFLIARII